MAGETPTSSIRTPNHCSRTTGVTPFQALFGINSRIPLDVIFPTPRGELEKWPDYVAGLQEKLQTIYEKMREQGELGLMRATAYQTGKVAKAIKIEEGDTVYYFSPRILPGTDRRTHKKLALLWTGPYQVRRVISDSLCIIHPPIRRMGEKPTRDLDGG